MEKLLLSFIFIAFYIFPSSILASKNETAYDHYQNKDYQQAFFLFSNKARVGDKDAQFNVGVMYLKGQYVAQDKLAAYSWINLSAIGGKRHYLDTAKKLFSAFNTKEQAAAKSEFASLNSLYGSDALRQYLSPEPLANEDCKIEPKPIALPQPIFPTSAQMRRLSGFVDLTFNISKNGRARELRLVGASDEVFIESAVSATLRAKWMPQTGVDGSPQFSEAKFYRITYHFNKGAINTRAVKKRANELYLEANTGDTLAQFKYARTLEALSAFKVRHRGKKIEYKDANEWYLRAAQAGNKYAEYELGRSLMSGKGCVADYEKGFAWLKSAASSGHTIAQTELAMSPALPRDDDIGGHIYWLRKAITGNNSVSKLYLAWELATQPNSDLKNAEEALLLLQDLTFKRYFDEVRFLETKAAAYASLGNYESAVKFQEKAIIAAKKLDWELTLLNERLITYKNNQPWTGNYHL